VPAPQTNPNPYTGRRPDVPRTVRDVVFVDGVRTPFGKAPPQGIYAESHADDLVINMTELADEFDERPQAGYGLTTMCVGLGMGGTVIWENPHWKGEHT
jgi:acetyl-CoA acetyltransferase